MQAAQTIDINDQVLISREQAAARYGLPLRTIESLYRRNPDFPIVRIGWRVMIHREAADKWFADYLGGKIDLN